MAYIVAHNNVYVNRDIGFVAAAAKGKKSPTAEALQCPCCGYDNALELKDDEAKRSGCKQTWKEVR